MFNKVKEYIKKYDLKEGDIMLLACSGGIDSMVLFDIFKKLNIYFCVAHCNFMLRSDESNGDEKFVKEKCEENSIIFFSKSFNIKEEALRSGKSIQMIARELRYSWMKNLLKDHHLNYIVTAHNLNDQLETFLINFSRGSGLKGLTGISDSTFLRPLRNFSRQDIEFYAHKNKIIWREDSSNSKNHYIRNKIRNKITPELFKIFPNWINNYKKSLTYLNESKDALYNLIKAWKKENFIKKEDRFIIYKRDLKKLQPNEFFIYEIFCEFGFLNEKDLFSIVNSKTGKFLVSKKYRLISNRDHLILQKINKKHYNEIYKWDKKKSFNKDIKIEIVEQSRNTVEYAILDRSKLDSELVIRKSILGDFFYPSGMKGKKKLSKYFKDEKYSLVDKENQWLLCSGEKIVWVVGKRVDRRFAASEKQENPLILKLS